MMVGCWYESILLRTALALQSYITISLGPGSSSKDLTIRLYPLINCNSMVIGNSFIIYLIAVISTLASFASMNSFFTSFKIVLTRSLLSLNIIILPNNICLDFYLIFIIISNKIILSALSVPP